MKRSGGVVCHRRPCNSVRTRVLVVSQSITYQYPLENLQAITPVHRADVSRARSKPTEPRTKGQCARAWSQCATTFPTQVSVQKMDTNLGHQAPGGLLHRTIPGHMGKYNPKDAIPHIVHDYISLATAGEDTQKPLDYPFNHYAERTFLTHCRALGYFFDPEETDKRDLHANDFVRKPPFSADISTWERWADHIDKHLMHLTVGRLTNTISWTGAPNKDFLREFKAAWNAFLDALKDDLKPLFDEEIRRRTASSSF